MENPNDIMNDGKPMDDLKFDRVMKALAENIDKVPEETVTMKMPDGTSVSTNREESKKLITQMQNDINAMRMMKFRMKATT